MKLRCLPLGRKTMMNLDRILETSLCWQSLYNQSYGFSVYRWESWSIRKTECQRIVAFKLWCWRRLLRVPRTARWSKQSILKEINPEYSLEGLMLKLQYFGHLVWRADSLDKTLMLGKVEGKRRRGQQKMRWLDSFTKWIDRNLSKLQERIDNRGAWRAAVHGIAKSKTQLGNKKTKNRREWLLSFSCLLCFSIFSFFLFLFPFPTNRKEWEWNYWPSVGKWRNRVKVVMSIMCLLFDSYTS